MSQNIYTTGLYTWTADTIWREISARTHWLCLCFIDLFVNTLELIIKNNKNIVINILGRRGGVAGHD